MLTRALAAPRRSHLIRANPPFDYLRVSTVAVSAVLRDELDRHLVRAAVGRILFDIDRDEQLLSLTIELYVQYGVVILTTADQARALAPGRALAGLLGDHASPGPLGEVGVTINHIHVSDVTLGDPHVVDPSDERHD